MEQTRKNNEMPLVEKVAIWKQLSQKGNDYLSGIVTIDGKEYKLVAFVNQFKSENIKRPDYISIDKK